MTTKYALSPLHELKLMSLPNDSHIYLTGKAVLRNSQQIHSNPIAFLYNGYVTCKPTCHRMKRIWGLFHYELHLLDPPPLPGLYNISTKVHRPALKGIW